MRGARPTHIPRIPLRGLESGMDPRIKNHQKHAGDPKRLLFNVSSPCSRLELLYERKETLVYVDLED